MTNTNHVVAVDDYQSDQSIFLRITGSDLTDLSVVLRQRLEAAGVRMCHEEVLAAPEYAAGSHLAGLISLFQRVDAARHGRKTWNRPQ